MEKHGWRHVQEVFGSAPAMGVFQALGAVIYAMEWTNDDGDLEFQNAEALADATNTISPDFDLDYDTCRAILEVMLLVDYGFPGYPVSRLGATPGLNALWSFQRFAGFLAAVAWRWKQGIALPNQEAWDLVTKVLAGSGPWGKYSPWATATLLYDYHSHCEPVRPEARSQGWMGYTGVLRELVAEVSTRGTDRLERKLSSDVHYRIPSLVRDEKRRDQMISIARDLASQHGFDLALPPPEAPVTAASALVTRATAADATLPSVAPNMLSWWESLASLFGCLSLRVRLGDEESGGEKASGGRVAETEKSSVETLV